MPAEVALERSAYLAFLHAESRVLKGLYHTALPEPSQFAAAYGRTFVVRQRACHVGKVLGGGNACDRVDHGFLGSLYGVVAAGDHLHDVGSMHFLVLALLFDEGDMEAVRAAEDLGNLAYRCGVNRCLKGIYVAEGGNPSQFAARLLNGGVGGHLARHLEEVLFGLLHRLAPFLDALSGSDTHTCILNQRFGCLHHAVGGVHRTLDSDVCGAAVACQTPVTH